MNCVDHRIFSNNQGDFMKFILSLILTLSSLNIFANCLELNGDTRICVDDIVYKGTEYSQGARIVAFERGNNSVIVKSIRNGNHFSEKISDLFLTNTCMRDVCPDTLVYKGSEYSLGARVVAINKFTNSAVIRSVKNGNLFVENINGLMIAKGCVRDVCVGDVVYKGSEYTLGAKVLAVSRISRTAAISSIKSGALFLEDALQLYTSKGCISDVCVGDVVFKGSEYSLGARVVGLNTELNKATVMSIRSNALFAEDILSLTVRH